MTTSLEALVPGSVKEGARAIWAVRGLALRDGGSDSSVVATAGLFVP